MQAVMMAAGRGSRMGDLVKDRPKPMLEVAGKTLLEHKFVALPDVVDEIILVVGYLADVITNAYGDSYAGKKIRYVTQENPVAGTMDALMQAKPLLTGKFLVMNGDNIYTREDMQSVLEPEWATAVERTDSLGYAAKVSVADDGSVLDITEASFHTGGPGLGNLNLYAFDTRLFEHPLVPKGPGASEYGLPQTAVAASKVMNISFKAVEARFWIQIKDPRDLKRAEKMLAERGVQ